MNLSNSCKEDKHLSGWFDAPQELNIPLGTPLRTQASLLINQLEYLSNQAPREILVGAGLFAASPKTIEIIQKVNLAKDQFKAAILALKKAKISIIDPALTADFDALFNKHRMQKTSNALKKMGLSRLHLKQCYRRIPFFLERPSKVSWTWANTRAITRISVAEVEKRLLKYRDSENRNLLLAKLHALSRDEPLAIVQDLAPHLRANIVLPIQNKRLMVKGPIPIFYLDTENAPIPFLKAPGPKRAKDKERPERKDAKLDPEPFISILRIHRYKTSL